MTKKENKKNTASIIDGKMMAEKIKDEVVRDIERLCGASKLMGERPNLAIILVGEREDSALYVKLKEKEAKKVGVDTHLYKCPADINEREIFAMIDFLNKDESVDAILVQLPLPDGFDTDGIIAAIDPRKDVDCFHSENIEKLFQGVDVLLSPVYATVLKMLEETRVDLTKKTAVILGNSDLFGKGLVRILEKKNILAQFIKVSDDNLFAALKKADIVITAVGQPDLVTAEMVKNGVIVIDIGIVRVGDKVVGDVDFTGVQKKADFITPVPGGVGPMTIAMLFKNVVELYKRKKII